jgi:membrane protein implicated in regulation of membrane protease activity
MDSEAGTTMIGARGTVTIATRGQDGPGEVRVDGSETFIAYSEDPLAKGTLVVIYDTHAGRRVDVEPLTTPKEN